MSIITRKNISKNARRLFRARNKKIRLLQFINHLMLIPAFIYGDIKLWLISIFMYFCMFCIGIDIGVHRYFSHRSFKAHRVVDYICAFMATLATVGSTISWVGMHRVHHQKSDKIGDPHSPHENNKFIISFLRSYFGIWSPYTAKMAGISDMRRDPLHAFMHNYYLLVIIGFFSLFFVISPVLAIFMYCVPAVMCFHGASIIVTLGHVIGKQKYNTGDNSRNSIIVHWLTWGEGLHNSHHYYPKKYNFNQVESLPWFFFDLPGFLIEHLFKTSKNKPAV